MRYLILAYNPNFVRMEAMINLIQIFKEEFNCRLYVIEHESKEADPVYCVQFGDTPYKTSDFYESGKLYPVP